MGKTKCREYFARGILYGYVTPWRDISAYPISRFPGTA